MKKNKKRYSTHPRVGASATTQPQTRLDQTPPSTLKCSNVPVPHLPRRQRRCRCPKPCTWGPAEMPKSWRVRWSALLLPRSNRERRRQKISHCPGWRPFSTCHRPSNFERKKKVRRRHKVKVIVVLLKMK